MFYNFYHLTNTVLRRKRLFLFLFILVNKRRIDLLHNNEMSTSLQVIISINLFTVSSTLPSRLHKNNNSLVRARCAPRLDCMSVCARCASRCALRLIGPSVRARCAPRLIGPSVRARCAPRCAPRLIGPSVGATVRATSDWPVGARHV